MYSEDEEQEQKVALMVVLGVAIFVVVGVLGLVGLGGFAKKPDVKAAAVTATTATAATAAVAPAMVLKDDESAVVVENGVVKFYFASGKSDIAKGGNDALADVVKGIKAGQKATISGFHDTTGDPVKNAELSKKRAMSVRDALLALGVTEDKLELVKPTDTQATGSNSEARRVEVSLVK